MSDLTDRLTEYADRLDAMAVNPSAPPLVTTVAMRAAAARITELEGIVARLEAECAIHSGAPVTHPEPEPNWEFGIEVAGQTHAVSDEAHRAIRQRDAVWPATGTIMRRVKAGPWERYDAEPLDLASLPAAEVRRLAREEDESPVVVPEFVDPQPFIDRDGKRTRFVSERREGEDNFVTNRLAERSAAEYEADQNR